MCIRDRLNATLMIASWERLRLLALAEALTALAGELPAIQLFWKHASEAASDSCVTATLMGEWANCSIAPVAELAYVWSRGSDAPPREPPCAEFPACRRDSWEAQRAVPQRVRDFIRAAAVIALDYISIAS